MSETDTKPVDPASVTPALPAVPDVPGSEAVGAGSAVVLNGVVYEEEDMTDSDASDDGSEYTGTHPRFYFE
jgi:hypothetical protein